MSASVVFIAQAKRAESEEAARQEDEAARQADEATLKEISERDRLALSNFLLGTSDMKSPTGARMHTLSTVIEEGSPTESTPSERIGCLVVFTVVCYVP